MWVIGMGSFVHVVWFKNESIFKCKNYSIKPIYCFLQMLYKAGVGFVVIYLTNKRRSGCIVEVVFFNPLPSDAVLPLERWRKRSVHDLNSNQICKLQENKK
jgi:hypothetical protein